jgi:hypothetical protein
MRLFLAVFACFALTGCVSAVTSVVTAPIKIAQLPVKAVSKTADVLTTSQSESDQKRGRALRQKEENLGKLARKRNKVLKQCNDGDENACGEVEGYNEAIEEETNRPI